MGYHDVLFPLPISYGSGGGPGFNSRLVQLASGAISATQKWADVLHVYDVREAVQNADDIDALRQFYLARRGSTNSFRFEDPSDFSTAGNGREAPGLLDSQIGFGDGTRTAFQLVKEYAPGTDYTYRRTITKPNPATLRVAIDGAETSAWSIDKVTGILTFVQAPPVGAEIRAGFRFWVPVIFGPDADALLSVTWDAFANENTSVPLIEQRASTEPPDRIWHGGSQIDTDPLQSVSLNATVAKVYEMRGTPTLTVAWILPDPSGYQPGGPHFVLFNATGSSRSITTVIDGETEIVSTVPAQASAQVYVLRESNGSYTWKVLR